MTEPTDRNLPTPVESDGGQPYGAGGYGLARSQGARGLDLADPYEDEGGIAWGRYLAALRRYKWLILLTTVIGTTATFLAARVVKPEYTVTATIWIQSPSPADGPVQPANLLQSYAWQELLGTNVVLDTVALRLRLYLELDKEEDDQFFESFSLGERPKVGDYQLKIAETGQSYELWGKDDQVLEAGSLDDSIGVPLGFNWVLPTRPANGRTIRFTVVTPRDASFKLRRKLTSNMASNGNFLRLTLMGTEPNRLAATLNAITEQFVSVAAEQKAMKLTMQASTLKDQLEIASRNLDEAETRLQQYRVQTITMPSERTSGGLAAGVTETRQPVIDQFFERRIEHEQLLEDISALESTAQGFQAGRLDATALLALDVTLSSPNLRTSLEDLTAAESELRDLRRRFTEQAPIVIASRERIRFLTAEAIPQYTDKLLSSLRTREQRLQAQINAQANELQEIPVRTITEQRLTREKIAAEALVQMLQNNHEETKLALSSTIPDVRLLDPAVVPSRPSTNRTRLIVLMGMAVSLAFGGGLALVLDHLDKRFRYPEQVSSGLGLPILGAIPAVRKLKNGKRSPEEASQVVEAFRTVRLSLAHSYGAAGPIMFTVSSPGPGDGKSLVSSNLALSFAEAGYSTLLIDGDIRRGELHRMFDLDRQPGLLDYLTEEGELDTVLRKTQHHLTVLPCGTRRHLGPELLSSPAMGELMARCKATFDVIIMDSPPLGAGVDPFILGTATGHLLMVLRSGETDRKMAEEKLKLVDRLPIRLLGAVLNDVDTDDSAYRYYSYVYDYQPDDEAALISLPAGGGGKSQS